jgi:hypothetical protein
MNDLLLKYNSLSPDIQKEVNDFLDFMLSKYKGQGSFDIKSWKAKIKNVSTWTEEDVQIFEENRQHFQQWKSEEW